MCTDPERGGVRTGTPSLSERLDESGFGLRLWLLVVVCGVHCFGCEGMVALPSLNRLRRQSD